MNDNATADSLRQLIGQIENAEYIREEFISIDQTNYKFPSLRDENLAAIDSQLHQLYFKLPTNNEIVCTLTSKNYAQVLYLSRE